MHDHNSKANPNPSMNWISPQPTAADNHVFEAPSPVCGAPASFATSGAGGKMIQLSVVIPAYNELDRLPRYLFDIWSYLQTTFDGLAEVVIVDDGSSQDLASCLQGLVPNLRFARHTQRMGKGAAVRTGIGLARGNLILVVDADGATPIHEEVDLRRAISEGADLAAGSRRIPSNKPRRRPATRRLVGWIASHFVRVVANCGISDTQCGFKMLTHATGRLVCEHTRIAGYAFDVEMLKMAQRLGLRVAEVPVVWQDMPGSKLQLGPDGFRFVKDVLQLRTVARRRQRPREGDC
jgi:dolichyl-phosphate beta-glucosyltransferase